MPLPMTGQFFNTAPPRPLLGLNGLPAPGIRIPSVRAPLPNGMPGISGIRPGFPRPESVRMTIPPKTTVFVGNISEEVNPELMEKILQECGKISEWKRLQGANGKLQAFGFCVFDHPDATRRALRLLNGFYLGGKALNIKIEEKVKNQIRDYEVIRRQEQGLAPVVMPIGELPTSKEDCDMDMLAKQKIVDMIQLIDPNLARVPEPPPEPQETKKVSSSSSDSDSDDNRRRSRSPKRRRRRSKSPSRRSRRERNRSPERSTKSRKSRRSDDEKSDDEWLKLSKEERQVAKEKEAAYQKKLKRFEEKEIRFLREVEKNKEKARKRARQLGEEAEKLRRFHEDYDDDVDDAHYYRGDSLIQRRREFDRQREKDLRDREAERSELEKIRRQILAEGDPKKIKSMGIEAKKKFGTDELKGFKSSAFKSSPTFVTLDPSSSGWEAVQSPSTSTKLSLGTKINVQKTEVKTNGLFEEEPEEEAPPKKKMKPFQISSKERIATLTPEERKRMIRDLIDTIPKTKDAIFAFPLHWDLLDSSLIESRIKPWVAKKVVQFIGEDEPSLVTFICDCIRNKTDPKKLTLDLSMVFDEEADSFVTKMWRLMIYETEAKRIGLTKDSSSSQEQAAL
uniref:RNA-binding protein 25 n=1 Tax=Panagrolaimus sp. JU765 TaxID=591449 RepID=A0AC34RN39_9BILA